MAEQKAGFFTRLKQGLSKTHQAVVRRLDEITFGRREISPELLERVEEILITSDLGIATVQSLMEKIRWQVDRKELQHADRIHEAIKHEIFDILVRQQHPLQILPAVKPFTLLMVGVNGAGKTTTIAKIAHIMQRQGHSVLLAAADTFRAAAAEQLEVWGSRVNCPVIKQKQGADPSAVAYDGLKAARASAFDVLIIDTAGRLHTKAPLMEEIKKVHRILDREHPGAPHETMLVLDATTGQNAITQAKMFKDAVNISGIALTKLDGTAKGGVIVAISALLQIPIRYIGVGEKLDDLREFNAREFVDALFEE